MKMATGGEPAVEVNKLTCAICLEKYRRPKLLPCFHTFCQSCLQTVAGPAPSFPCPACRATVLLPLGGVASLQTNFYIEQDLDNEATPPTRLCDVCTEDREATHTCLQCQQRYCAPCRRVHDSYTFGRSHTVVSLQPGLQDDGNLKGASTSTEREESCLKHRNQPVILHCTVCKSNICMQCKLTSHEGHATEDLSDTGAKVKAELQGMLEKMMQQTRNLEGVLAAIEDKRGKLQSLKETSEQGIRERAGKIHQWVDECRDKVLESLQSLNKDLMDKLSATQEDVQRKAAALSAQSDHVTRVLRDDKDADIVAFQTELKDLTLDKSEVSQLLDGLSNEPEPYRCEHDPVAISLAHLAEYVGVIKRSACGKTNGSLASDAQPSNTATPRQLPASSTVPPMAVSAVQLPAQSSVTVSEVVYSRNPQSKIVAMCTTSEKRVRIKYKPSGSGEMMGLFNKEGRLKNEGVVAGDRIVTVLDDVTLGNDVYYGCCSLVPTDGGKGAAETNVEFRSFSKCGNKNFFAELNTSKIRLGIYYCSVKSADPLICEYNPLGLESLSNLLDVSTCGGYFALSGYTQKGTLVIKLYFRAQPGKVQCITSYPLGHQQQGLDACFFPVDGQEMLLVVVNGDNKVHVVDHTDGCRFVRYLDTAPVTLERPYCLATDHEKVVWIGCHGGKVVLLEM